MLLSTLKKVMFYCSAVVWNNLYFTVVHMKSHSFCTSSYWWPGKRCSCYVLLS